jgi:hypothetical protein
VLGVHRSGVHNLTMKRTLSWSFLAALMLAGCSTNGAAPAPTLSCSQAQTTAAHEHTAELKAQDDFERARADVSTATTSTREAALTRQAAAQTAFTTAVRAWGKTVLAQPTCFSAEDQQIAKGIVFGK